MKAVSIKTLPLWVALGLTACADMKGIAPTAVLRDAASFGLKASPADAPPAELVRLEWWRDFGDEGLNQLMAQALAGNPNLKLAQARLTRAQAATQAANAALSPQLGGEGSVTHQQFTRNGLYPPPLAGAVLDTGTLQLTGGWEFDFFGKNRAALDAALGGVHAAEAAETDQDIAMAGGTGAAGQQCGTQLLSHASPG